MQQVSENLLFEHKKTYIDSYVALYKYLNDFFVKKLTDLNTSNLHRDPEQKTKLLFHFVHYSSIRSMKSVILEFNKAGRMHNTKLFQLYQTHDEGKSIEPCSLIEYPSILSFAVSKSFLDHLQHVDPLQDSTYLRMKADYQNTLDELSRDNTYTNLVQKLLQDRINMHNSAKKFHDNKLWNFKFAAIGVLLATIILTATILMMHLSLQATLLFGGIVLLGTIFLRIWREKLTDLCHPIVAQAYDPEALQARFGEDFHFPPTGHTPGFLNRLQKQLTPVMDSLLQIESNPENTQPLTIENGRTSQISSRNSSSLPRHLPIGNGHTQDILRLMDSAFKAHEPPSYTDTLSNPSARLGYQNYRVHSEPKQIKDSNRHLQITDGSTIGLANK